MKLQWEKSKKSKKNQKKSKKKKVRTQIRNFLVKDSK